MNYLLLFFYGIFLKNFITTSTNETKIINNNKKYEISINNHNKKINILKNKKKKFKNNKRKLITCNVPCNTCDNSNSNFCYSCIDNYYLNNGKCIKNGYYYEVSNLNSLKKCHPNCKSCNINGDYQNNNCILCNEDLGFYSLIDSTSPKNCYSINQKLDYYYFNFNSKKFEKCIEGCIKCSYYSMQENDCEKCDFKNDYYPKFNDNNERVKCIKYSDIINNNYFLFGERYNENSYIKECYSNCKSCFNSGNIIENNCIECKNNYKKSLDNPSNCIIKDFYKGDLCESTYKHKIFNILFQGECINDCFNTDYNYIYNYQCFNKCPNRTISNFKNECIDNNECVINIHKTQINLNSINKEIIHSMVISYMNEFLNNVTHVKYIYPEDNSYSIIIYKSYDCLRTFKDYPFSKIYFNEECLSSIRNNENISMEIPLIIVIIDIYRNDNQPHQVNYLIYNSINGNEIENFTECKKNNVTLILPLNNMKNVDLKNAIYYNNKYNINVFNEKEKIFIDKCETNLIKNGYDLLLKDRFELIYQNITFCDKQCSEIKKDYDNLEVYCNCFFNSTFSNIIYYNEKNIIVNNYKIGFLTFDVMKCHIKKNVFKIIGFIITFILLFFEFLFFIIYLCIGMKSMTNFLAVNITSNPPK